MSNDKEALVTEHLWIAETASKKMFKKIKGAMPLDDLYGYACLGLVQAANRFNPNNKNKFVTFAFYRVRGAIIDGIKKEKPKGINVDVDSLYSLEDNSKKLELNKIEDKKDIERLMKCLSKRERMVVSVVLLKNHPLSAVSRFFGITEARVSQILSRAVEKMSNFVNEECNEGL